MSNYQVSPIDSRREIYAGWDPMLNTYFAHVIDTVMDEDEPGRDVLWIGCTPNEIHDVDVIKDELMPHVLYDDVLELVDDLYRDANA